MCKPICMYMIVATGEQSLEPNNKIHSTYPPFAPLELYMDGTSPLAPSRL